ncbi:hypothetical protein CDAR_229981 [Caerostris darwini]|uniref:Uncharacterized protein n=1 Tax=Caerostris darwini TaxID=1538125 RepID=A0AAV4Q2A0_9ARAC|nr:hypothetical protein CDAR_229981 [Caerostris darwini]
MPIQAVISPPAGSFTDEPLFPGAGNYPPRHVSTASRIKRGRPQVEGDSRFLIETLPVFPLRKAEKTGWGSDILGLLLPDLFSLGQ